MHSVEDKFKKDSSVWLLLITSIIGAASSTPRDCQLMHAHSSCG